MADLLNNTNSNANNYGDDAIVTLSPREHIRLRPGMYVGVVGDGSQPDEALYVLIKEVVDNSIDEFIMGAGRQIDITLAKEAGAEILPVVLDGTKTLIKKNLAFNWGNRITVRVLPPVPAERVAALETHELMQEVHERMCTALGEVRNEKLKVKDQK